MNICVGFDLCVFGPDDFRRSGFGIASLSSSLRFFAGVFGFALTAQVQAWIWAGLVYDPSKLSEGITQAIFAIAAFRGPVVNASTAAMAGAVAVLGFGEHRIVPHWLAWLSLVFGTEQAIETVSVFEHSGFIAPGGSMNIYLGGLLGFIWVGGVAHWSMQKLRRA